MVFLNYLINGISLGSIYAIIALGYTMVYGIAKMLNFAHGDVIMVGAYICFFSMNGLSSLFAPGSLAALVVPALAGTALAMVVCTVLASPSSGWPTSPCGRPPPWRCSSPPSA